MVKLVKHDLEFILRQIRIAEAHAAGGDLAQLVAQEGALAGTPGTNAEAASLLPYGLRTVDGSYNNLIPGREFWGAADRPFNELLTKTYLNQDDDRIMFGTPTNQVWLTNNNYAATGVPAATTIRQYTATAADGSDEAPEVQTIAPGTLAAGGVYRLIAGDLTLATAALDGTPTTGELLAAIQAADGYGDAAFTVAANDAGAIVMTWKNNGDVADVAKLTVTTAGPNPMFAPGSVVDADPRIISNLIVDQTAANSAALAAMSGDAFTFDHDGDESTPDLVFLPNIAPDEGLSSPFNGWMTLFGQFFDHGLDLVSKGGNGTVYVPLQPDDPLYVEGGHSNFMVLTRLSPDAVNRTTSWVDQNQTYGSTASKQIFMREYVDGPDGKPIASGHMLGGAAGGLATWSDIKAQAADLLGIRLTDADVGNIPLVAADPYGNFIPGANGYPQVVVGLGSDGRLGTDDDLLIEGNPAAPIDLPATTVRTAHAFIDDIAHTAAPVIANGALVPDGDDVAGNDIATDARGNRVAYDDELLGKHFVTGDGRGNENIGLTAVHHIFHSEHNRIVEETKQIALSSGDLAFLNEWLLVDVDAIPTTAAQTAALVWDGERLFQAGRFTTEMEYQHLVFEEFARKIQPDVDAFVFNPTMDVDPTVVAEFAHVVYRFGHSMLTEDVAIMEMIGGKPVSDNMTLIDAFLNPRAFDALGDADEAAGAIIRGMTRQVGNEIDEFVTPALRNNLLGLPLDLATINMTRARDAGIPSLNAARQKFYDETLDSQLKPYDNWVEFAENLKNPASIINFIAAYGTHDSITGEATVVGKRAAATALVLGQEQGIADDPSTPDVDESRTFGVPDDRVDFLNSTGDWATAETGLDTVDFWVGGLAEKKMAFGGMLGSTFSFVFEMTLENLQNGDRFYYLSRTQGLNLLNQLENNSMAELVMRNTDLGDAGSTTLPADAFSAVSIILEMDLAKQTKPDPTHSNPTQQAISPLVTRKDTDGDGDPDYIKVVTNEHVVIGGTDENDTIISGGGDDSLWGRGGDDYIEAGYGVDRAHGGEGDDIIVNAGTDIGETDFLHGGAGNDVIHGGSGLALVFGNEGNDFLITGPDGKEAFGGSGDDFILGGQGGDVLLGNEGSDWLEGGEGFDTTAGDNSELFFNSTIAGHDVMFAGSNEHDFDAESGDDIMVQGESVMRNEGMFGFDWAIHKGNTQAGDSDMAVKIFTTDQADVLRDRFDQVEALSGWNRNDVLTGDDLTNAVVGGAGGFDRNQLSQAGVDRIDGLRELLGDWVVAASTELAADLEAAIAFDRGNILIGGSGSDTIQGRGGDDLIDGDAWLNVRIRINDADGNAIGTADGMTTKVYGPNGPSGASDPGLYGGKSLGALMFDRTLRPDQLEIVREIVVDDGVGDTDTAVYWDVVANYTFERAGDGSVVVTHSGFAGGVRPDGSNAVSDGVDKLRNVEKLRFGDGNGGTVEFLVDQLFNVEATGAPTISDTTPTEGRPVTASLAGVIDPDGLPTTFAVQWQAQAANGNWANIAGATAATFLPAQAQVGRPLRALVSFTDLRGHAESVTSAATQAVGDLITGTAAGQTLNGTAFADEILGLGGNDILNGNAGDDLLDGGTGGDRLVGGTGDDTYVVDAAGDVVVENAGQGNDTVRTSLATYTLGANVENLVYTGGAATTLTGNGLQNTITGGAGDNVLRGVAGDDRLVGLGGNDRLDGGTGADTMLGGTGNDSYVVDSAGDVVTEAANEGIDTIASSISLTLGANVENLTLTGTAINGTGNALANRIEANNSRNFLTGGDGADLFAFQGNTPAIAAITTGATATTRDRILDFAQGLDKIDLSEIDASRNGTAADAVDNDAFAGISAGSTFAAGTIQQLRYFHTTIAGVGYTIVQGNTDADTAAEFQIELVGTFTLTASDFVF